MYMYNKAYESLVASKWIIFLFKSRNILCVLTSSLILWPWVNDFSALVSVSSKSLYYAFLNKLLWWLNEVTLKSKIPDTVIAQQSWVTIVIIICLNILVVIFATPLPRLKIFKIPWDPEMDSDLIAALLGISLYIFKSTECKLLNYSWPWKPIT